MLDVDTPMISRHEIRERTVICSDKILPFNAKLNIIYFFRALRRFRCYTSPGSLSGSTASVLHQGQADNELARWKSICVVKTWLLVRPGNMLGCKCAHLECVRLHDHLGPAQGQCLKSKHN